MLGKAKQDAVVAGAEQGDWPSTSASFRRLFADHGWLLSVSPPLFFFPVCCMHDESPVSFVCV
jgi:hypothetical protein